LRREDQAAPEAVLDAWQLIELASTHRLASVETPLHGMVADLAPATLARLRMKLTDADLALVVDSGVVEVEALTALLPLAAQAGAKTVRATLSTILEGARAKIPGGWDAYLRLVQQRIGEIRPLLERHGILLALENHQDATSDDLLALCEAGGGHLGVTFDVANPLAVAEDPLVFARKLGPHIHNVHLKDYHVFATPQGYRLVRCALGEGVVPFAELLPLLASVAPHATLHIELAAQYARHIRVLDDEWWTGFPARDIRDVLPVLRLREAHARPSDEPWQTLWECAAPTLAVVRAEHNQFEQSVHYLRSLLGANVELST
jgi:sugar phosphate isomerase/epimerase